MAKHENKVLYMTRKRRVSFSYLELVTSMNLLLTAYLIYKLVGMHYL